MPASATLTQSTAAQAATIGGAATGFTPVAAYLSATGLIDINATALLNFGLQAGQWVGDIPSAQTVRAYAVILTDNALNTAVAAGALDVTLASAVWYYSNQTLVADDISAAGLRIASNMENSSDTTNTARLLRQGQYADSLMDGRLRAYGCSTPLSLDDDTDANILQGISNAIVIAQLCRWRVLQVSAGDGMNSYTTITKLGSNFWDYADNMLTEIGYGRFVLKATRSQQAPGSNAGAFDIRGLPLYPAGFSYLTGLVSVPPWNG